MNFRRLSGILFICFPILVQIPFTILSLQFNYPDILRQPSSVILTEFSKGGTALIMTWYFYALSILVFIAGILAYERSETPHRTAGRIGLASASIQLIALLRWTFLVPFLARGLARTTDASSIASIETIFTAQHNFLGVGLGEHLGQLTMAIWTFIMIRANGQHIILKSIGYLSVLLLVVGLVEHLAVAFDTDPGVFQYGALVGFILWSVWLIGLGINLVRDRRHLG
jgi:hypothetical protein